MSSTRLSKTYQVRLQSSGVAKQSHREKPAQYSFQALKGKLATYISSATEEASELSADDFSESASYNDSGNDTEVSELSQDFESQDDPDKQVYDSLDESSAYEDHADSLGNLNHLRDEESEGDGPFQKNIGSDGASDPPNPSSAGPSQSYDISLDSIFRAAAAQLIRNNSRQRKPSVVPPDARKHSITRPIIKPSRDNDKDTQLRRVTSSVPMKKRVGFRTTPSVRMIPNRASSSTVAPQQQHPKETSLPEQVQQKHTGAIFKPTPEQAAFIATGMGLFTPHPLLPRSDSEFEDAFNMLKEACQKWAQKWFGYRLFDESSDEDSEEASFEEDDNDYEDDNDDDDDDDDDDETKERPSPKISPKEQRKQQRQAILFEIFDLCEAHPELVNYTSWIADGRSGWDKVFLQPDQRAALVYGILGKVFEIYVFGSLLFGGTKSQLAALLGLEKETSDCEGFKRTALRAAAIKTFLGDAIVPPAFESRVESLTLRIYTLISPLLPRSLFIPTTTTTTTTNNNNNNNNTEDPNNPGPNTSAGPQSITPIINQFISSLHSLVRHAGKIAVDMRRETTIYYITPVFKDEMYNGEEMRGVNFTPRHWGPPEDEQRHRQKYEYEMQRLGALRAKDSNHGTRRAPNHESQKHAPNQKNQEKKVPFKPFDEIDQGISQSSHLPLVKMVCFPCITAYRPGSGLEGGDNDGYRTRIVSRADVFLHWATRRPILTGQEDFGVAAKRPVKDTKHVRLVEWLQEVGEEKRRAGAEGKGCCVM